MLKLTEGQPYIRSWMLGSSCRYQIAIPTGFGSEEIDCLILATMAVEECHQETQVGDLPEVCLVHAIALTSPRDACRCAAVSLAFHAAAESDHVWCNFLPKLDRQDTIILQTPGQEHQEGRLSRPLRRRCPRRPRRLQGVAGEGERRRVLLAVGQEAQHAVGRRQVLLEMVAPAALQDW
ncbi:uncharacterized protein LOC133895929 [Phragmites australis]|uniref:uncharacterized protein LOC133895929 n=1 Tax=Phragmites australis TaxID=29695 RepID=UPI002D79082E|nr:uncharacterized protein LOC133895929 [Phragmites australis]